MSGTGPCLIIAEAGVNHDGATDAALALVYAAAAAGADAVKFQSFRTELVVRNDAPQAEYQARNAPAASQADMLRALELSPEAHRTIAAHCASVGITFLSTAFDQPSLELLLELGVPRLKVASGELTNGPMLLRMARTGLPLIVSTGMATLDEVANALAIIAIGRSGTTDVPTAERRAEAREHVERDTSLVGDVTILHCTSSYPAPPDSVHLRAMATLRERFGLPVGYATCSNNGQCWVRFVERTDEGMAIHVGHAQVGDYSIQRLMIILNHRKGLLAISGYDGTIACAFERLLRGVSDKLFIIYNQNNFALSMRLRGGRVVVLGFISGQRNGQVDPKGGALSFTAAYVDKAIVTFHDAVRTGEP